MLRAKDQQFEQTAAPVMLTFWLRSLSGLVSGQYLQRTFRKTECGPIGRVQNRGGLIRVSHLLEYERLSQSTATM